MPIVLKKEGKDHVLGIWQSLEPFDTLVGQSRLTEANAKCVELRKKAPEQFGSLTLEECKKVGFGFIREERMQGEYQKVLDEIKESVTIKKNQKFDRDDFLANKIDACKALRKSGGCEEPNSTPAPLTTPR